MNIQNIPRSDKSVKAAFVPKLDGFLACDYPNIELKVLGYYLDTLGWSSLAELFRAGGDMHKISASGLLGVPEDKLTDEQRQIGKVFNFSIVYGGGARTLIEQGVADGWRHADRLLERYHKTWPGIGWDRGVNRPAHAGTLIAAIKGRLAERGYITTLYGRHLHPHSGHVALNALCQGCAADLMKWAMVRVGEGLRGGGFTSHMVNTVHDELILDVSRSELNDLVTLVPEWMTDPRLEAVVPIRPGCEVSWTTWADKEAYVHNDPPAH